jgi:glycosyltransferase involved in cell wall biosynthesis
MNIAFSTGRPAHVALPANLMVARGIDVTLYTAAYRSRFRQLDPTVRLHWVPQIVSSLHFLTGVQLSRPLQRADTVLYDRMVSWRMGHFDIFWGWATGALESGRSAQCQGARFVLDRACPHVDVQQTLVEEECTRLGVPFRPEPSWFRERQLAEYDESDLIVVPSDYSRRSFPLNLQSKVLVAPLFGRLPEASVDVSRERANSGGQPFTFGTVGGQPLRKGFLYLLDAWEQLSLPNARLLIRTDAPLGHFPALRERLRRLANVEIVGYVKEMSSFYERCDAFVFPTLDDGFGMALIEAMAQGLPSVTTTHCGAGELFTPNRDLLIVPARDSAALASAMDQLHNRADLREHLRRNALEALTVIRADGAYSLYAKALDRLMQGLQVEHR